MESTSDGLARAAPRTWKPTAAGIFIIISGALTLIGALVFAAFALIDWSGGYYGYYYDIYDFYLMYNVLFWAIFGILMIFGILTVIGGIFALKRRSWGMALTGAIFATLTVIPLGIPAIIFVAMGKKEFD